LLELLFGLVEIEHRRVRLGPGQESDTLEILSACCAGELLLLAEVLFRVGEMPPPVRRVPTDAKSVEPRHGIAVADRLERLVGEHSGPQRVSLAHQDHVRQPGQSLALEDTVSDTRSFLAHGLHLSGDGGEIVEPPGGLRGQIPALDSGLELDRAQERVPSGLICLAGERSATRLLQGRCGLAGQVGRWRSVEIGEKRRRVVEVVRPDLEQLVAGPLSEPLGEARMV
jgi:hypothetical protein